jgi:hypothetical protein
MEAFQFANMVLTKNVTARQGCNVVVPFREDMAKRHLKVTGDLGRVTFMVRLSKIRRVVMLNLLGNGSPQYRLN